MDIQERLTNLAREFRKEYIYNATSTTHSTQNATVGGAEVFLLPFSSDARVFEYLDKGGRDKVELIQIFCLLVSLVLHVMPVFWGIGTLIRRQKAKEVQNGGKIALDDKTSTDEEKGKRDIKEEKVTEEERLSIEQRLLTANQIINQLPVADGTRPATFRECLFAAGAFFFWIASLFSYAWIMSILIVYFGFPPTGFEFLTFGLLFGNLLPSNCSASLAIEGLDGWPCGLKSLKDGQELGKMLSYFLGAVVGWTVLFAIATMILGLAMWADASRVQKKDEKKCGRCDNAATRGEVDVSSV